MTLTQHGNRHSSRDQIVAWSFVGLQALLLALIVLIPRGGAWTASDQWRTIGAVLMAAGVVVGTTYDGDVRRTTGL